MLASTFLQDLGANAITNDYHYIRPCFQVAFENYLLVKKIVWKRCSISNLWTTPCAFLVFENCLFNLLG